MKLLALLTSVLMVLTASGCPEKSAGTNQPDQLPECAREAAYSEQVATVDDGKFVYDFFVELWDDHCNSAAMVGDTDLDEAGDPTIPPVHIHLSGHITDNNGVSRDADFLGGSAREKDVNTPYHLRAFVAPRNAPHDMLLIAAINARADEWIRESLPDGALHCRITRDSKPIPLIKNRQGRTVDRVEHTVPLHGTGRAQVSCHLTVPAG